MADTKVSALTAATTPLVGDELVPIIATPGGTPTPKKATVNDLRRFAGARASHNTTQSIPNGTYTAVVYNTEEYDTAAIHDVAALTSRFTVPAGMAGKWRIIMHAAFSANATGYRQQFAKKNGTTFLTGGMGVSASSSQETYLTSVLEVVLAAGDFVEQFVAQSSGGALTMISGDTAMSMVFVAA